MARARNIKPSIMDNEELAELDPLDRLLFIYLWMLADREGRLEDRPKRIAKQALAYDRAADADAILNRLQQAGFIRRYVVGGIGYIQILNFTKHQSPHGTEKDGEIPDENGFLTVHERTKNGYSTGNTSLVPHMKPVSDAEPAGSDNSGLTVKELDASPPDNSSLTVKPPSSEGGDNTLIPDSGFTDSLIQINTPLPPKGGARRSRKAGGEPDGFPEFWAEYPRKDAKADAQKAWRQLKLHENAAQRSPLMAGLACWRRHEGWTKDNGRYIPLPATFLRGLRWLDESVCGIAVRQAPNTDPDALPDWCVEAGFEHMAQAANAHCHIGNYREFRDGKRIAAEVTA